MDHETFLSNVEDLTRSDRAGAERAVRATLQTLGERIDRNEAREVAAQLPPEDAPWLATASPAQGFDVEEFVGRVAEREGVDRRSAQRHALGVLEALARAVDPSEWRDVTAELSSDFAPLLPRGPWVDVVDADWFLRQVEHRAGLAADGARRAADAVLQTLAERIADGEVEDLAERLPEELRPPLRRGVHGGPEPMAAARFVHRVAEREGVVEPQAAKHARAVLLTLRDAVGLREFLDVTDQLPADYDPLII